MDKSNTLVKKIIPTAFSILILIYIAYQIIAMGDGNIMTETAMFTEISDSTKVQAYAVRNEVVVTKNYDGVINFNVEDGEKVHRYSTIANIYNTQQSVDSLNRIEQIDTELENLYKLVNSNTASDKDNAEIQGEITATLSDLMLQNIDQDYSNISVYKSNLQYSLSQKDIANGSQDLEVFNTQISELESEKNSLNNSYIARTDYVVAPEHGYFTSMVDGYENSFDYDNIEDITVSEIQNVKIGEVENNAIGKITKDFDWYLVAVIDELEKYKFDGIEKVYVDVPVSGNSQISATIESINHDPATDTYALVLRLIDASAELLSFRSGEVSISTGIYEGVLVSQESVYFKDITEEVRDEEGNITEIVHEDVKGVYINYGGSLVFLQIFSDITIDGYLVCKTVLSEEEQALLVTDRTIRMYDNIVTEEVNNVDP